MISSIKTTGECTGADLRPTSNGYIARAAILDDITRRFPW